MEIARGFVIHITRCARIDLLFTMSDITPAPDRSRAWRISYARERVLNFDLQLDAAPPGGARRDRTDDLLLAKQALSQLSYGPFRNRRSVVSNQNTEGAARAF